MKHLLLSYLCIAILAFSVPTMVLGQFTPTNALLDTLNMGLDTIIVEKYYIADKNDAENTDGGILSEGSVTYRVYVDMKPGFKLKAVYGNSAHLMRIETSTSFFNNADRGGLFAEDIDDKYLTNNTNLIDSWLSMGPASKASFGVLKTDDEDGGTTNKDNILANTNANMGKALNEVDGKMVLENFYPITQTGIDQAKNFFESENSSEKVFSSNNGSWYVPTGVKGITKDNYVLIGQFTTDGSFSFELNIQMAIDSAIFLKYKLPTLQLQFVAKYANDEEKKNYIVGTSNPRFLFERKCLIYEPDGIQVSIISPIDGSQLTTDLPTEILADVSDSNGNIVKVEFFENDLKIGEVTETPYKLNWIAKNATLKVKATDNLGNTKISDSVVIDIPTNIKKESLIFDISPNPVSSNLTISLNGSVHSEYSIFDITGQKVLEGALTENSSKHIIEVNCLRTGLYVLKLNMGANTKTCKFVKQ